jgi:hypothetical protein
MRSREVRVVVLDLFTLALPLMGKHCLGVRPYVWSLYMYVRVSTTDASGVTAGM